jgi:hypothetical protein
LAFLLKKVNFEKELMKTGDRHQCPMVRLLEMSLSKPKNNVVHWLNIVASFTVDPVYRLLKIPYFVLRSAVKSKHQAHISYYDYLWWVHH